jgi:broad specificity phosphatase PhoE
MKKTVLFLLRHGATAANLAKPPRLQGRRQNPPLAPLGVRQAELTRDFLAIRPFDCCYSSPLLRAVETAEIIAQPHGLKPIPHDGLTECDVGRWEGLDWETIRAAEPDYYQSYMADPARYGYPEGESFADVYQRSAPALDEILRKHTGSRILVIAHHVVNRTYLATLLGLGVAQARAVQLNNCGISVVETGEQTVVTTLNASFHLQGAAA